MNGNGLLPLGTVVYLKEGTYKVMIVGQGPVFDDDDLGREVYTDYMGIGYPDGFDPDQALFFNDNQIDEVIFRGYEDEEAARYSTVYSQWKKETDIPQRKL